MSERSWKLWPMGQAALVDRLRALAPVYRRAVYATISEELGAGALADLQGDRERFWYRREQLVSDAERHRKKMVLFIGNRGDGKTDAANFLFDQLIRRGVLKRPRIFAATADDVADIVVWGVSGIMSFYDARDPRRPAWIKSEGPAGKLRYPNGVEVLCYSAQVLKGSVGHAGDGDLYDDLTKWAKKEDAWNHARTSCREGIGLGIVATSAGEGEQEIWKLMEGTRESARVLVKDLAGPRTDPPTRPNLFNLSYDYYDTMASELGDTDFYRREMLGEKVSATSPFTGLDYDSAPIRVLTATRPEFDEIVVAVDPAEGKGGDHDDWGIGAAGRRRDQHIVALDDMTGSYDDDEAAATVLSLCELWHATVIVAETNRGERAVRNALKAARNAVESDYWRRKAEGAKVELPWVMRQHIRIVGVSAKDSKGLRAGPLRVLYLSGQLHHVSGLRALEKQQREWKPKGPKRPRQDDRIDWLVHAVHYLADLDELGASAAEQLAGLADATKEALGQPAERPPERPSPLVEAMGLSGQARPRRFTVPKRRLL